MPGTVIPRTDISAAREALRFTPDSHVLYNDILGQYRVMVLEKIAVVMNHENNSSLTEILNGKWSRLNGLRFHASFLHPELLARLFYGNDITATARFFEQTLDAELARKEREFDTGAFDHIWTTNGSFMLNYDREGGQFNSFESFLLNERLPVDFFSPYCMGVSAKELCEPAGSVVAEYNYETAYPVYEKLFDCMEVLHEQPGAEAITSLVYDFTNVVICKYQVGNDNERHFFSSSDTYYVGRTILGNPDLVSNDMIIDSLVHEATHALLYMIDEKYQWQPGLTLSGRAGNVIVSPWTGNRISARNYLQAVFVWYALFNLWQYCLEHNLFSQKFAADRLVNIQTGFREQKINEIKGLCGFNFDEVLIGAINSIRQEVLNYKN